VLALVAWGVVCLTTIASDQTNHRGSILLTGGCLVAKAVFFEIENFQRIQAVRVEVNESGVTFIEGKNGQGKSSICRAIFALLGGKKAIPEKAVKSGKSKGKVSGVFKDVLNYGDLRVELTVKVKGTPTLTITNEKGDKLSTPQTILSSLKGVLGFNPVEFLEMDAKKQLEVVQQLCPELDTSDLDRYYKASFEKRTEVRRNLKFIQEDFDKLPYHKDVGEEYADVPDTADMIAEAVKKNSDNADKRKKLGEITAELAKTNLEMEELNARYNKLVDVSGILEARVIKGKVVVAKLQDVDVSEITQLRDEALAVNDKIKENIKYNATKAKVDKLSTQDEDLTKDLESFLDKKAKKRAEAKYPVEGLSVDDEGLKYNGLPIRDHASGAEGIGLSTDIMLADRGPDSLPLLIIDRAEQLDDESSAIVAKRVEAAGAQAIFLSVGKGKNSSLVIEDGMIKEMV